MYFLPLAGLLRRPPLLQLVLALLPVLWSAWLLLLPPRSLEVAVLLRLLRLRLPARSAQRHQLDLPVGYPPSLLPIG